MALNSCDEGGHISQNKNEPFLPWDRVEQLLQANEDVKFSHDVNLNDYSFYERLTQNVAPQVLAEVKTVFLTDRRAGKISLFSLRFF